MHCCGSPYQEITVRAGSGALALLRCTHCDSQRWARDGELLERDVAFAQLASAYREVPLRARAARDRAAAISAARQAARTAHRAAAHAQASSAASPSTDAPRLIDLLQGWQVLGATA